MCWGVKCVKLLRSKVFLLSKVFFEAKCASAATIMKNSALRQKVGLVWCSVIVQRRLKHKVQGPVDWLPSTINFNDWSTHTYIQWSEVCIRIGSIAKQYIPLYFENFTVMVLLYIALKDIYIGQKIDLKILSKCNQRSGSLWKFCDDNSSLN